MSLGKYWNQANLVQIREALAQGAPLALAAKSAGVPPRVLKKWFQQGEDADPNSTDPEDIATNAYWSECVRCAAKVQLDLLTIYKKGSRVGVDWRAAESILSRLDPENWSTKQTVEHQGEIKVADVKTAQRAIQEEFGMFGSKEPETK